MQITRFWTENVEFLSRIQGVFDGRARNYTVKQDTLAFPKKIQEFWNKCCCFSRTASVFPKTYTIKQVRKVFGSVTLLINANQTLYFPGKRPELQRKGKV